MVFFIFSSFAKDKIKDKMPFFAISDFKNRRLLLLKIPSLSSIKRLAGQTMWYGASSIAARFLNYLLTPYLTAKLSGPAYGDMTLVYSALPFLNVIFTYGLETAYFRYVQKKEHEQEVYNTATV